MWVVVFEASSVSACFAARSLGLLSLLWLVRVVWLIVGVVLVVLVLCRAIWSD